jgi:hypothetical protein
MGNPLVAFALVADEYEKSGDPIKGLKPLFAPILSGKTNERFDAAEFADRFTTLYGLHMTPFVANALSERLADIGLLKPDEHRAPGNYLVADFEWHPETIEEHQIDQTINLFARWAGPKLEASGRRFLERQLEDAILQRLARPEFSSIFADDDADADRKKTKLRGMLGIGAVDPTAKDETYLDYLVADFVLVAAQSAPEVFDSLSKIAYGSLIADAAAGLAISIPRKQPDPPLRVVLDGPIILDLLDLNTIEHRIYAEGLLAMVNSAKLMVAVFDHSVDEMRGSIRSTLQARARGEAFGPLAERFRTTPGHTLYASTVMDALESKIKALGITILPSGFYEEARYKKYFPEDRVDKVRNSIGDLHEHMDARMRDAISVATVARLKGEKKFADSVFESGTVFITRNSVLCRRVLRALSIGRSEPDPRFTIATDGQLAGVLWFVSGIAGVELSRKRQIVLPPCCQKRR